MEATERRNYPYYIILGYTPPKGTLGILVVAPLDGCPATAPHFTSTQALRSRRVSSASKSLDAPGSHLHPPSLRSWLCGSTKEPRRFCGEPPQTLRTQCSLHSNPTHNLATTSSRLDLGFEAQLRNRTDFVLLFFPPYSLHLISFGHRVH
jgi:hypothetical protein